MKSKLYLVGKQFVGRTGTKLALISLASALAGHSALAATPTMQAQSAALSGASNTVVITRVPTTTATGAVKYWNITLQFDVDGLTGKPTIAPLFPTIVSSPSVAVGNFKPGTYTDGNGGKYTVGGPNIVAGGRTSWSISMQPDAPNVGFIFNAAWTTGPIAGHPNQASLTARTITSTAFSWGIVGSNNMSSSPFYAFFWGNGGAVVGASQTGNSLVLHLFNDLNATEDSNASLTLCATAAC